AGEAPLDSGVLGEFAVARERRELGEKALDIIREVRPFRMARDQRFLPRRQIRVEFLEREIRLALQAPDFVADRDPLSADGEPPQLLDFGIEFRDGLFEIEISAHKKGVAKFTYRVAAAAEAACAQG